MSTAAVNPAVKTASPTPAGVRSVPGEWVFLLSLYGTASYAALLLAAAEGAAFPAGCTPLVAVAAALLVERTGRFHLSVMWANALGLVAAGAAVFELLGGEIEARLLFGAHLLVYLSWIVLFQRKDRRVFWATITLSLLQAAVASVLTSDGGFGLALAVFLPAVVWTLMVHQVVRPRLEAAVTPGGRPPAADGLPVSELEAVAEPPGRIWRPLGRALAAVTGGAAVAGVLVFLLMPRVWTSRRPPIDPGEGHPTLQAFTGFTGEVRLGALGEILESSAPALTVALRDGRTGESRSVEEFAEARGMPEPRFRGRILDRYRAGRWTASRLVPMAKDPLPTEVRGVHPPLVVQSITLHPVGGDTLFSLTDAVAVRFARPEWYAHRRYADGLLSRPDEAPEDRPLDYEVFSPARPADPRDLPSLFRLGGRWSGWDDAAGWDHAAGWDRDGGWGERDEMTGRRVNLGRPGNYLRLPPLPALRAMADRVTGDAADPAAVARRLEAYLERGGGFVYSLNQTVVDPNLDPVEDFLLNKRAGHCEYYASALALMLRAEGIPSRLVTGFKGGALNPLTERFEVQQRHAHAWVEAWITRTDADGRTVGEWVTLDPTPAAARTASVARQGPRFTLLGDLRTWANTFWAENVVQMNLERQKAVLFNPLRAAFERWKTLAAERGVAGVLGEAGSFAVDPRRWVSVEGGLATFVLLWLAAGLWWAARRLRLGRDTAARRARPRTVVPFYERFRALAARRGLTRRPGDTDREFAEQVRRTLAPSLPPDLADAPVRLADEFYRVRFGEVPLDEPRAARWGTLLDRLEAALPEPAGVPS